MTTTAETDFARTCPQSGHSRASLGTPTPQAGQVSTVCIVRMLPAGGMASAGP